MYNMNKFLTIIIPTYNMERYLTKCLDSLVNAKTALPMMEILVINDGSKDSSSRIAHEYEAKYPGSVRVIDKENGNYGSCINRGLKEATGKYVKVLDADDWFKTENLVQFMEVLATHDVDLVLTDFDTVNPHGKIIGKVRHSYPKNQKLAIEDYCGTAEFCKMQMHSVTYRTAMVKNIGYHQTEGISYTDQEWIFEPMSYVKTFVNTGLIIYQYLMGREGQTMNPEQMRRQISHTLKGLYAELDAYKSSVPYRSNEMICYLQTKICQRIRNLYRRALFEKVLDMDSIIELDDTLKSQFQDIYDESGKIITHKLWPFRFVEWWRTHSRKDMPWRMVIMYKLLLSLKNATTPA